ncbi:hypothetical protein BMR06_17030, partial [Methylococcaceae bacterium HT5]
MFVSNRTCLSYAAIVRSKGRFQSIGKLGQWAEKMLNVFAVKVMLKKIANWLSYTRHSLTSVNQENLLCGLHPRQKSFRRSWKFLKITDLIKPLINNALSSQES